MRSIFESFTVRAGNGKRWAAQLALIACACVLSACAGGGVRNTARTFKTVVVDAGHGGHDNGTRSSRLIVEKDAALDVAQRLNAKLRAAGFGTVMTRNSDVFIPLDTRNDISNRTQNAIFISVHFNEARPKPSMHGVETYYYSSVSAEIGQRILQKVGAIPGGSPHFMKPARFRVLRNNRNPAVLVECGYLSNRAEAARCATAEYRDQIAGAIAQALVEQRGRNRGGE